MRGKTKTNVYGLISDLLLEIEKREHKIFSRMIQILTKVWGKIYFKVWSEENFLE